MTVSEQQEGRCYVGVPRCFGDLIAPVRVDDFFARYWESEVLHVRTADVDRLRALFDLDDLDRLLGNLPSEKRIRCIGGDAGDGAESSLRAGKHHLQAAYDRFDAGRTLSVSGVQDLWEPVGRLCRDLVADLGMRVQANLYITPRGGHGFGTHSDGHDVLVLQTIGRKTWPLYETPTELPRPVSDGREHDDAVPARSCVVGPGDVLYIPRGTPHRAAADEEASAHLTIGLVATTWEDVLAACVRRLGDIVPELRSSLPHGWWDAGGAEVKRAGELSRAVDALSTDEAISAVLDVLAAETVASAPIVADGQFARLADRLSLDIDTVTAVRAPRLARVVHTADDVTLAFPGGSVTGPIKSGWAFSFAARAEEFRVGDVPGWYSDEERVAIVAVLVRAGFARLVGDERITGGDQQE